MLAYRMIPPEYTEEYEIKHVSFGRPHVVLLGAGASYAAFPNGDKNGRKLPLLKDFVEVIGLEHLMSEANIQLPFDDFEAIYSRIALDPDLTSVKGRIDTAVYTYFESLELPEGPTLYDHLILSLRRKDVIATFNWDPFLWNACHRNRSTASPPSILFLHGSVAIGRCDNCKIVLSRSQVHCKCGRAIEPVPILFPVTKKNYNSDAAIAAHWRNLQRALKECWAFTIFGYSAPKTDVEAVALLKEGWGRVNDRNLEEIEIIDIKNEDSLRASWDQFIHTHHYTVKRSYFESWLAEHPRRSCEAIWAQNMDCMFIQPFTPPRNSSFEQLHAWFKPRIDAESAG
ncbi:hypothetical protein [Candidatus Manganitrophus noduliformans]|uniref:SIR2-like domain-containing protein n=1 Tax=Candidatus Manganitrophus noduliformans TaxID=2606439 RepID=A0A7X6IBX6_9BACT|nr:hypothetical protein [Candidatus Manganitrophus noduliformans]NKE71905.1 hypothetical protein [Candidatus Manganitrophus noduliformans]